nr:hypothetical protein [Escherichia coli]
MIPADRTWRPQPLLKPLVDGPQRAVVTGPAGEEIFCDEHGRVRVKFNWDRYNPADQDSSCWIRVAQAWAGTGFQDGDTACGSGGDCRLPQRRSGPADHYGAHLPPGKPHPRQPAGNKDADDHPLQNVHGQRI